MSHAYYWSQFDGQRFQELCNLLLHLEVSPKVRGYNALGKDQGVDAWFEGSLEQKEGKWRFQAKLHLTDTQTAINQFKAEIKADIRDHLANEDGIIYMTNVSMTKKSQEELCAVAEEQARKLHNREIFIAIWDGARIQTWIECYPFVQQQYWGNVGVLLEPYQNQFAGRLNPNNNSPFNLHHAAVKRKEEVKQLFDFLDNDHPNILSIIGPGGYGKTRLAIDFFKEIEELGLDWKCLGLLPKKEIDLPAFKQALLGKFRVLIFLDDAHELSQLADILSICRLGEFKNRVKVIMTSRIANNFILREGVGFQNEPEICIELKPLEFHETADAVINQLNHIPPSSTLSWLCEKSGGVPIMIQALCHAYVTNKGSNVIQEQPQLKDAVATYLKEILESACRDTSLPMESVKKAIWMMALVSPITNHNYVFALAELIEISDVEFIELINHLINNWLLEQTGRTYWVWYHEKNAVPDYFDLSGKPTTQVRHYRITPDPIAELISLWYIDDTELLTNVINWAVEFGTANGVILNIYRSTLVPSDRKDFGKSVLLSYLETQRKQTDDGNATAWHQRFNIMKAIAFVETSLVIQFLRDFVTTAKNPNHPIHIALAAEKDPKSFSIQFQENVKELFAIFASNEETVKIAFDLLPDLIQLYEDPSFLGLGFAIRSSDLVDRNDHLPFTRLHAIFNCIMGVDRKVLNQIGLLLWLAPGMLRYQLVEGTSKGQQMDEAMMFTTLHIPNHPSVIDFRCKLVSALIASYLQSKEPEIKENILRVIAENVQEVSYRRQYEETDDTIDLHYDPTEEFKVILRFLGDLALDHGNLKRKGQLLKTFGYLRSLSKFRDLRGLQTSYETNLEEFSNPWDQLVFKGMYLGGSAVERCAYISSFVTAQPSEKTLVDGLGFCAKWVKELEISRFEGLGRVIGEILKCKQFNVELLYSEFYRNYPRLSINYADDFLYEIRIHNRGSSEFFQKRINQILDHHFSDGSETLVRLYNALFFVRDNEFAPNEFDLKVLMRLFIEAYQLPNARIAKENKKQHSDTFYGLLSESYKRYPERFKEIFLRYLANASNEITQLLLSDIACQIPSDKYPMLRELIDDHAPHLDIRILQEYCGSWIMHCIKHHEGVPGIFQFISKQLASGKSKGIEIKDRKRSMFDGLIGMEIETHEPHWHEFFAAADWVMAWDIPSDCYFPEDVLEMYKLWNPGSGKRTEFLPWIKQQGNLPPIMQLFKICLMLRTSQLNVTDLKPCIEYLRRRMPPNYEKFETAKLKNYDPQWHWGIDGLTWLLMYFAEHPVHDEPKFIELAKKLAGEYAFTE